MFYGVALPPLATRWKEIELTSTSYHIRPNVCNNTFALQFKFLFCKNEIECKSVNAVAHGKKMLQIKDVK